MAWLGAFAAVALIGVMFLDAFESMILPRRIRHYYRLSRFFYRVTWASWRAAARLFPVGRWRSGFLSVFGPLSLFALLTIWAVGLIVGFALLHWSLGTALTVSNTADDSFGTYVYFSGTTFFTLGYGDIVPTRGFGRALSVAEAGIGFGFLAVALSYLPVLYQAFSRREITISLLDARAGSPPSAGEFLRRLAEAGSLEGVGPVLMEWERWAAELLESNLSYPVLRFYRSQHDNQSWVAALTAILDSSAVLVAGADESCGYQARLTFAMARHAAVDLVLLVQRSPEAPVADRLPEADFARLRASLGDALSQRDAPAMAKALSELRGLYEPFVNTLAKHHEFTLPPFLPEKPPVDNWQTSPGMPRSPGLIDLQAAGAHDEHDD
jgi:hypothetical protein